MVSSRKLKDCEILSYMSKLNLTPVYIKSLQVHVFVAYRITGVCRLLDVH